MEEPTPQLPRPCSTPHSASAEWLEEVTKPYLPIPNQPACTPEMVRPRTRTRHDGWTGECMATFCETLAETAVVAEACEAAGKHSSGAYALRRRSPVFAAAWDAALTIARERLADTLLARSMEGNIEQIWRDGEVVGERHTLDNRLGLQILRRLDRLAESVRTPTVRPEQRRGTALPSATFDWNLAVEALRTGDENMVCRALALVEADEIEEVEGAPNLPLRAPEEEGIDLSHRFWQTYRDGEKTWFTDFPPPPGFTGYESCDWGEPDEDYERECTPEESAILKADAARAHAAERAEEEALRDEWLALLRGGAGLNETCA